MKKKNTFEQYAFYYDLFYEKKDYTAECDFLDGVFRKYYPQGRPDSILDLGCGTGNHDVILARRGHRMTGVDLSSKMIRLAKEKAKQQKQDISFVVGDIRNVKLRGEFDAVISMFAVMSYLTRTQDILSAFRTAHRYLKRKGIFVFDVWFGPGVLAQKPQDRIALFKKKGVRIVRLAKPEMDLLKQTVNVHYIVMEIVGRKLVRETRETHPMRYFFPQEIDHFLEETGFKILAISPVLNFDRAPTAEDWNVSIVAQKK